MDFDKALQNLRDAQGTQRDMRDAVAEAHDFTDKRDGQWESGIIHRMRGKPRYTDDKVNPIVNQIAGEMENAEFTIRVRPAGGDATKQMALTRDGLIRNIRNLSNADQIFGQAARKMIKGGFAAWLVTHDYYDQDSFDQDLLIEPIHDAHARVWLDQGDLSNDGSDAKWGVVLHYITKEDFEEQFGSKVPKSIGTGQYQMSYYYKPDFITIAHYYYLKPKKSVLYKMSDGQVLRESEELEDVLDELAEKGIEIEDERVVTENVCYMRMMDAGEWLTDEQETVFDTIPIVPVYGNFEVADGKIIYRGVVEKLMDMQRVHNYAVSRYVEEVALAPRKKIFMTPEQAKGHEESIRTMNTNMNPVQFYNHVGAIPPPYEGGTPNPNTAVQMLIDQSSAAINQSAGLFAANMGDNPNLQSGVAIDKQIDRGNNGTSAYFEAMETAIRRTGIILNKAIPKVYDAERQVRLLKEDGSYEMQIMNQTVLDQQTNTTVTLNDLTVGKYDVVCDIGAAYKNRQQEATELFARALEKDPSLMQVAGDIWVNNIPAVGFDKIAERLRAMALNNGMIPLEQMTEEERQAMAQQPQDDSPSAEEMQMQIAMLQAQTAQMAQQNQATQHQIKMQELQVKYATDQQKTQSKLAVDSAKIDQTQQRIDIESQRFMLDAQVEQSKQMIELMRVQNEKVDSLANAVKNLSAAIGADVMLSRPTMEAVSNASDSLNDELKDD